MNGKGGEIDSASGGFFIYSFDTAGAALQLVENSEKPERFPPPWIKRKGGGGEGAVRVILSLILDPLFIHRPSHYLYL